MRDYFVVQIIGGDVHHCELKSSLHGKNVFRRFINAILHHPLKGLFGFVIFQFLAIKAL
jgi:hypothetical protein